MQTLVATLCMLLHLRFITRVGIPVLMTSSSTFQVLRTLKSLSSRVISLTFVNLHNFQQLKNVHT